MKRAVPRGQVGGEHSTATREKPVAAEGYPRYLNMRPEWREAVDVGSNHAYAGYQKSTGSRLVAVSILERTQM